MDIRQLRYFSAVVEMGSFSKAALKLSISQPSLSQQIAEMEAHLGAPLLFRSPAGTSPTEAGLTIYRHARHILAQFEQMRADVRSGERGLSGNVAIGFPTSVSGALALPLYDRLQKHYPGVRLNIVEGMSGVLAEQMASGQLDMAVLFRDTETRGIAVTPLLRDSLCVYGARGIGDTGSATLPLAALSGVPLVLPGKTHGLRLQLERVFAAHDLELVVEADIDSLPMMIAMARRGGVATILSNLLDATGADLLRRDLIDPAISRTISLCRLTAVTETAAARAVQQMLLEIGAEIQQTLPAMPAALVAPVRDPLSTH